MSGHYTPDELADHLTLPDKAIEEHTTECESCAAALERARRFHTLLSDPMSWATAVVLREGVRPPSDRREAYRALRFEREQVMERLQPLLRSVDTFREADITHSSTFRSVAAVHVLTKEANRLRQKNPQFALLVAESAVDIADKLGSRVAPHYVANAWLERGIACGALGRHRDAYAALSRAEKLFDEDDAGDSWELANVWLSLTNVCIETDRLDEAFTYAERAAGVYLAFGDMTRYLRVLLLRGGILYSRGQYREGADAYEGMIRSLDAATQPESLATAQHNGAYCYLELGQLDRAETLFSESLATWDRLGFQIQRARAFWGLASVALARGQWQRALDGFVDVRRQLGALGLINDEALVRLQIAEVLLLLRRAGEVRPVLDGVVVQFATEGMMRNARRALAYIEEAAHAERLTPAKVRYVREYLSRLETQPSTPFVPLD